MRVPVAVLALVLLAGCAGSGEPSRFASAPTSSPIAPPTASPVAASPTAPVLPTTEPTGPSWTPRPVQALLLDAVARVTVDQLNVRKEPRVGAKILGVLERGNFVLVTDYGPYEHDGYAWYPVVFVAMAGRLPGLAVDLRASDGVRGWIAATKGSARYVEPVEPRCPATIDLESMRYMLGTDLLGCFGSNSIELSGTFGCGGCGGFRPGSFEPAWLAHPLNANFLTSYPVGDNLGPMVLHFAPGGPAAPPVASVVRVTGHFDDAAAATCRISIMDPLASDPDNLVPIPDEAARLACAQQFVVDALEVLGTDPGFPLG